MDQNGIQASITSAEGRYLFAHRGRQIVPEVSGVAMLMRDVGALIRAGYDKVLPDMSRDPSHGLRLAARVGVGM